jgi:hypothetical protein
VDVVDGAGCDVNHGVRRYMLLTVVAGRRGAGRTADRRWLRERGAADARVRRASLRSPCGCASRRPSGLARRCCSSRAEKPSRPDAGCQVASTIAWAA